MFRQPRSSSPSVYDTLCNWAKKTSTSFAELKILGPERGGPDSLPGDGLIYRLKQWPDLPSSQKTAEVYRTLSLMSNRPVNRHWILASSRLSASQVDQLIKRLVDEGALEVIDASKFSPADPSGK